MNWKQVRRFLLGQPADDEEERLAEIKRVERRQRETLARLAAVGIQVEAGSRSGGDRGENEDNRRS